MKKSHTKIGILLPSCNPFFNVKNIEIEEIPKLKSKKKVVKKIQSTTIGPLPLSCDPFYCK